MNDKTVMSAAETRKVLRLIQQTAREIDQKASRAHMLIIKDQPISEQVYAMLVRVADLEDAMDKLNMRAKP